MAERDVLVRRSRPARQRPAFTVGRAALQRPQNTTRFPWQLDVRLVADAEFLQILVQQVRAGGDRNLRDADVGRLDQHVRRIERPVAVHVVDRFAPRTGKHAVFAVHRRIGRKSPALQSHRQGDHFHHRSGLARRLHGRIQPRFDFFLSGLFVRWVEARNIGQRQDLAVGRIHHDHAALLRVRRHDAFLKRALGHVLDHVVDRQRDVGALLARVAYKGDVGVLQRVRQDAHSAGAPVQVGVQLLLEARIAVAFGVHAAHYVRADAAVGILPARVPQELDRLEGQAFQPLLLFRRDVALQQQESPARTLAAPQFLDLLAHLLRIQSQRRGDVAGEELRRGDFFRIDGHRLSRNADREQVPRAVANLSAQHRDLQHALLLGLDRLLEFLVLYDLQDAQANGDDDRPQQGDGGHGPQAPLIQLFDGKSHAAPRLPPIT